MRRRRAHRNIEPSMATRFPSLSRGPNIDPDVHMFTEDIHLAIMPIGGRTDNQEQFTVELNGDEQDCEKAKELIGELGQYDKYDIPAMVCDAIENIARHLVWEGQAVFEIIEDNELIYINSFTSKNLIKALFWYIQIIPNGDWDLWKRKVSVVRHENIWKVKIPIELGGTWGFKKVIRKLRKYSHLGPEFYRQDLARGMMSKDFNLSTYVRNSEIHFNRVTKKWGWNRRDWSQEKCTEFYTFYKKLSFNYAQALLREHIIKEINRLLVRLSIKCKLIVAGLPTSEEILQIRNDMQKGEVTFAEVSDKLAM